MKKTFVIVVCLILAFTGVVYAGGLNNSISVSFDSGSSCLNISGVFSPVGNEPVTMVISKATSNKEFSVSNTPDMMFVYVTDNNGEIKVSEKISSAFSGGRYDVILTGKNTKIDDRYFIFMNPSDPGTISLIDSINSATSPSEVKAIVNSDGNAAMLGIDAADRYIAAYSDSALGDILSCKALVENKTFTPDTFLEMFSKLIAVRMINDGHVDDAMLKYASYFATTSEQYKADNALTDSKFEELLKNAKFSISKLGETYDELLLVAKIKSADNWSYMQDLILAEFEVPVGYNSIKTASVYKVFTKMYDERASYSSIDSVNASFDKAVKAVIKEEEGIADKGTGGKNSSSSISVPAGPAPVVVAPEVTIEPTFNDISGHFAEKYIQALASENVINGYGNGEFLPNGGITRAEFSKVIVLRFGIDAAGDHKYADVAESDWFAPYIYSLSSAGIVNGYDGAFNPNALISRQDAAVICMRVAEYLSKSFDGTKGFADSSSISDYAIGAVGALGANGIINGDGDNFRPTDNITRGETTAIICRLYEALN